MIVNGEKVEADCPDHWTLLELLRYRAGLTGAKQGCDKGDCGACTVLVDGKPTLACCTLAKTVRGEVTTIEGLATPDGPHPLQRAFDACGALQCGFCQTGMILSAKALLDRNPSPDDAEIRQALSGNLCRCTGYTKIVEAVKKAATTQVSLPQKLGPAAEGFHVVGARGRKADAIGKATGTTQYTDDLVRPRMAHGRILRSPHAHARIRSIDTSRAAALEGVFAVIVGSELPTPYCVIPWTPDETALATDKVRYVGEGVAAVAAVDEDTAIRALALIEVDYEVLSAVLTPDEALATDAPRVHESDWKGRERRDNVCKEVVLEFGDVDAALGSAAATVQGHWSYAGSTHGAIEPHCALAEWDADGRLTLWSATQVMHYLHRELARQLDVPESKVRVVQPAIGGAFGGKSEPFDLEICAALLAKKAGRPVKILYTREEVFYAHRGRHPMEFDFRISADADGRITAVDNDIVLDGGAYHSFGLVTTYYAGQLLPGPLRFGTYRFRSRRVYTNKPCCGPKRGHGSVQPRFPLETAIDELAAQLGLDPIEIRRINAMESGETTVNGQLVPSTGILACLDAVEAGSDWKARHGKLPFGRGLGVATSMYISGTAYPIYPNDMPQSGVQIRADRSGRITVFSGTNDIGQGSSATLAWIVAEELGCDPDDVHVVSGDTQLCPVDLGAYSSRVTYMAGIAAREAGQALRAKIMAAVAEHWGTTASRVVVEPGRLRHAEEDRQVGFVDALRLAESRYGVLGSTGGYKTTKKLGGDYRGGTIGASPAYSATAHVAEVDVDPDTGIVKLVNLWAAHDCGRAINPTLVEGQIEGSVHMGLSEALYEHHDFYLEGRERGLHRGPSLLDYRIATALDTPPIAASIVESLDPGGPYGAKEAGEGPLHPAIPAIANAIHDAVGIRLRTMPFTPDRILAALEA
ncbi:MAG: molybdopterin-dependent oxidoreductase [Alphaproteobacteria bacterium]|nr:molybdopterin-dependent oxidoreductase [Alphaproteobacteria bacterium]